MVEQYLNWISSLDSWTIVIWYSIALLVWGGYFVPKAYKKLVDLKEVSWHDWYSVRFTFWLTSLMVSISASVLIFAAIAATIVRIFGVH